MAKLSSSPFIRFASSDDHFFASVYVGPDASSGLRETMHSDVGMQVEIDFRVPWTRRLQFLYILRGSCGFDGDNYWRQLPVSLPTILFDSVAEMNENEDQAPYAWDRYYCTSMGQGRPLKMRTSDDQGEPTGWIGWPYAEEVIIPTVWTVPMYTIAEDPYDPKTVGMDPSGFPYTTTRWRTTGEIFSPYTNAYKFVNDVTPANEANIGILRAKTELSITRHFMPFVDTVTLDAMIGKVNLDPIQIGSDTNPFESMLYLGYETEQYANPSNGKIVYDITHRIMVNGPVLDKDGKPQESWNYYMNRKGYWDKLVLKDNETRRVYDSTEFKCKIWPDYVDCEDSL
jgi:hypothetical protein